MTYERSIGRQCHPWNALGDSSIGTSITKGCINIKRENPSDRIQPKFFGYSQRRHPVGLKQSLLRYSLPLWCCPTWTTFVAHQTNNDELVYEPSKGQTKDWPLLDPDSESRACHILSLVQIRYWSSIYDAGYLSYVRWLASGQSSLLDGCYHHLSYPTFNIPTNANQIWSVLITKGWP